MKLLHKTGLFILLIVVSILLPLSVSAAALYGVALSGSSDSSTVSTSLYSIDPDTGDGTFIADLGYAVNAIAIDPTTGLMYGATAPWGDGAQGLLLIDPSDGSTTPKGDFGEQFDTISALAFSPSGHLFGWHTAGNGTSDLVTINPTDGKATAIKNYELSADSPIMVFGDSGTLILIDGTTVYEIDPLDEWQAQLTGSLPIGAGSGDAGMDPVTGLLWTPVSDTGFLSFSFSIRVMDIMGGDYVDIDTNVPFLQALEFDTSGFDTDGNTDVDIDSDGDGILDSDDFCPETPEGLFVNFEGCSSQQLLDENCGCDCDWKNHGEYVTCIVDVVDEQVAEGLITLEEKGAIVSQHAGNDCGKKKK